MAQAAWAASGGPEKARDRLPEGRTRKSPKELTGGGGRHKDGAVDKAEEHKSLERMPEHGLGGLLFCSGMARDFCFGRYLQLREMKSASMDSPM